MTFRRILLFILVLLISCNSIETSDTLKKTDTERIRKLNLLDKDEKIEKFYSEFRNEVAGNFFTDRRIAKYWIDERDKLKDVVAFAFYQDIKSIDGMQVFNFTDTQFDCLKAKVLSVDSDAVLQNGFWKDELEIMLSIRQEHFGFTS